MCPPLDREKSKALKYKRGLRANLLQTPDLHKAMKHLEEHGIPFFGHNE